MSLRYLSVYWRLINLNFGSFFSPSCNLPSRDGKLIPLDADTYWAMLAHTRIERT